jgi:DNA topoisomerase-3
VLSFQKKEAEDLPLVNKSDTAICQSAELIDKKNKPLSRLTEGTLINAMAGIARYVENPKAKSVLRESAGICTEATRASIIETLKQRNYVQLKGKTILSTEHGRHFIDSVPGRIKDLAVTAWWEQQMSEIAEENADANIFLEKMTDWMCKLVASANPEQFSAAAKANPKKSLGMAIIMAAIIRPPQKWSSWLSQLPKIGSSNFPVVSPSHSISPASF